MWQIGMEAPLQKSFAEKICILLLKTEVETLIPAYIIVLTFVRTDDHDIGTIKYCEWWIENRSISIHIKQKCLNII
jgi:hypothetical protein